MNNIKKYRLANKMKQIELCKIVGVTQGALSGWESGRYEPSFKALAKMSEVFHVSINELIGEPGSQYVPSESIKIPVYGTVAAGIPLEAITEIDDYEEITPELAAKGEYVALKIHGDSMEPKMSEGDVIIVRLQDTAETGDIAVVMINGEEATCKKIKKTPEGLMLISFNTAYEPMFYSNQQISDLPVRIFGKVVELRAKFN